MKQIPIQNPYKAWIVDEKSGFYFHKEDGPSYYSENALYYFWELYGAKFK